MENRLKLGAFLCIFRVDFYDIVTYSRLHNIVYKNKCDKFDYIWHIVWYYANKIVILSTLLFNRGKNGPLNQVKSTNLLIIPLKKKHIGSKKTNYLKAFELVKVLTIN